MQSFLLLLLYENDHSQCLPKPFLNQYYLLNATLGKISFLEGDFINSKEYYLKTMMQTNFQAEKDLIGRMIKKIEERVNVEMQ